MGRDDDFSWLKWYPLKWLGDRDLQACSPTTRGCWMNWLMEMWAKDSDRLTGDYAALARWAGATEQEAKDAVDDLKRHCAASVRSLERVCGQNRYLNVTVKCRAFARAVTLRKSKAAMMKRLRDAKRGKNVTTKLPPRSDRETRRDEREEIERRDERSGASDSASPSASKSGASKPGPVMMKLIEHVLSSVKVDVKGVDSVIAILSGVKYSAELSQAVERMLCEVHKGKPKNESAYVIAALKTIAAERGAS